MKELSESSAKSLDKVKEIVNEREKIDDEIRHINTALLESQDNSSKLKSVLNQTISKKEKFDEIYQEIFGFSTENEDGKLDVIEGKKADLDNTYNQLIENVTDLKIELQTIKDSSRNEYQEFKSISENEYQELKDNIAEEFNTTKEDEHNRFNDFIEIGKKSLRNIQDKLEKLMPKAMTAGLASAYEEKILSEEKESRSHRVSFFASVILLVLVSSIPFVVGSYRLLKTDTELMQIIQDMPNLLAVILPLYFPILWLAYSANKSYKLSKRLVEEYTHKGVLSKTFEGLANQIEEIDQQEISNELRTKLLYNLIDVNSENPGKLISDYNKSDHPLMDALDKSAKLANSIEKLSKIPGFSAIAKKMEANANKIIRTQDERMSNVINDSGTKNTQDERMSNAINDSGTKNTQKEL